MTEGRKGKETGETSFSLLPYRDLRADGRAVEADGALHCIRAGHLDLNHAIQPPPPPSSPYRDLRADGRAIQADGALHCIRAGHLDLNNIVPIEHKVLVGMEPGLLHRICETRQGQEDEDEDEEEEEEGEEGSFHSPFGGSRARVEQCERGGDRDGAR